MHVSYADMRLGEKRFRAGDFLDFRWLGYFPSWALFSHPVPLGIGYFLYGFVDVFSHRVWDTGALVFIVSLIPFITRHTGVHTGRV